MNSFKASQEGLGSSNIELLLLKILRFITFDKSTCLAKQIEIVTNDSEKVNHRKVF